MGKKKNALDRTLNVLTKEVGNTELTETTEIQKSVKSVKSRKMKATFMLSFETYELLVKIQLALLQKGKKLSKSQVVEEALQHYAKHLGVIE
jgi:hypothetical protein